MSGSDQTKVEGVGIEKTVGYDELPEAARRTATDRPDVIEIEVVGGPMDGQRSLVRRPVVTIGRSEDNDLALALDTTTSTRHARIIREDDHYWLEDLGSRNGTYLGDERIRKRTLIGPGTLFTVGRTSVEFSPR